MMTYSHYFINANSASVGENIIQTKENTSFNFVNDFPGSYLEDLRKPFKIWATKRLPSESESSTFNQLLGLVLNKFLAQDPDEVQPRNEAEPTILYRTDGFPLLPAIDFDTISPTSGRPLLTAYILSVWGKYCQFLMIQQCFNFSLFCH
jgi:hypothetical protein